MEPLVVRSTADPGTALAQAEGFLRSRPIENNLVLTLLSHRSALPSEGRYWWARRGPETVGFVFQSPLSFRAVVSPTEGGVVDALVESMVEIDPDLPGVASDAVTAAAFAGRWAERRRVPAVPTEGQRIYRLDRLCPPAGVPGWFRQADASERDVLVEWAASFLRDTGSPALDPVAMTDRYLDAGRLWVWDRDGQAVSMATATAPVAGVSRVACVYTPPPQRSKGYAAACVAALTAWMLDDGAEACVLYTQLANPTSNGIYQRLGYVAYAEGLVYRFG